MPSNTAINASRRSLLLGAVAQRRYTLAGAAMLTLESLRSETHHSYLVRSSPDLRVWFVDHLVDGGARRPVFMGTIQRRTMAYRHSPRSAEKADSAAAFAFRWWWDALALAEKHTGGRMPAKLQVWSSGHCSRCGRDLTDPASVARGVGPVCWAHVRTILDVRPRLAALAAALDEDGYASPLWAHAPREVCTVEARILARLLGYMAAGDVGACAGALHLLQSIDAQPAAVKHLAGVVGALAVHAEGDEKARRSLRADLEKLAPARLPDWWLPDDEELEAAASEAA